MSPYETITTIIVRKSNDGLDKGSIDESCVKSHFKYSFQVRLTRFAERSHVSEGGKWVVNKYINLF